MLADLAPADPALAFLASAPPGGDQAAEARVASAARGEQDDRRAVIDGDLGPDEEPHAHLARLDVPLDDAVHAVAVGERHGLEPERRGGLHELLGVTRPLEEGEVALAPERGVAGVCGRHGGARLH